MLCKTTVPSERGTFGTVCPDEDLRWVKLVRGSKGDLIGLLVEPGAERGKVCLPSDLPDEAVAGQFAVVDVTPTRSGRAYHATLAWALACRTVYGTTAGGDGKRCLFSVASLEAAESALAHLLADRADKAEQDAIRADADLKRQLGARDALEAELAAMPADQAELVRLMKGHDWWYEYSDDQNVWRAGRDREGKIRTLVRGLPGDVARGIWSRFAPEQFREALPA
jgi:hypothetical protein